ncbi:MAG TPA: dehydratase [Desulfobacteraceae bacterium]|nr:dehydratase [Desulfobacteraceae bacterium]
MATVDIDTFDALKDLKGRPLPKGRWIKVTQDMVDAFARATLDHQWIHTDTDRARRESPFGGPVAHGFLSLSLVSYMIGDLVNLKSMKMGVNYGVNRVRLPSPVPVGSRLRLNCRVGKVEAAEAGGLKVFWQCEVEIEHQSKPACVCELISLIFE